MWRWTSEGMRGRGGGHRGHVIVVTGRRACRRSGEPVASCRSHTVAAPLSVARPHRLYYTANDKLNSVRIAGEG